VDESLITGEGCPVDKLKGGELASDTVNLNGSIEVVKNPKPKKALLYPLGC